MFGANWLANLYFMSALLGAGNRVCMKEPTYRNALVAAWKLIRHHSTLWILGILAVLSGQLGINSFVGQLISSQYQGYTVFNWNAVLWPEVHSWLAGIGVLWLAIILGVLIAAVAIFSVAAQGALVAASADEFHTTREPDITFAWHQGVRHFWRILSVAILKKVLLVAVLLMVSWLAAEWINGSGIGSVLLLAGGLFSGLVIASLAVYTTAYIVIEEYTLGKALGRAWNLFHHHMLVSLETSAVLLVLNTLVLVAVVLVSSLCLLPSLLAVLLSGATGSTLFVSIGLSISIALFVALVVFVGGVYNAYTTAVWTYLFLKMHREGVLSRVMHHMGKLVR